MATDRAQKIRAAVLENLNLKILSLVVALVLYSLSHGPQDAQRALSVDLILELPNDAKNRDLVSNLPPQVRVTLRGPRQLLDDVRAEDIGKLRLDVATREDRRVFLEPRMVTGVPAGLRVEKVDPEYVDLTWEDRVFRDVPVQLGVVGTPAAGFNVRGPVVAEPAVVRVAGPKSEVQLLQHVRAESFDIAGLTEGVYGRPLALERPAGRITVDVPSVRGTVTIGREVVERVFDHVQVAVVGPFKARTQPPEVDVRLVCPPEMAKALRREQVVPRAEVPGAPLTGSAAQPVTVTMDRCEAHVTPSTVIVRW